MPVNKTKGEIEARLTRSRSSQQEVQGAEMKSKEVDLDMERLIRSAEGPNLSREFEELLKALKASLNNNHFTYKKALDKIINFIRVIKVNKDNFLEEKIVVNGNDSGTNRYTMLLTVLREAQVAAFPESYLQPNKGITYICPTTRQLRNFQIPKHYIMSKKKLIMILRTSLKAKKNKNNDDMEMIKLLRRYLENVEANLPKTQFNKDDLDDDEQKKNDQNPFGSNPSQSIKPSGSKGGEKKKEDDKKDEKKKSRDEDHFQHLAEEIVRIWIVSLREVRVYFKDGRFILLDKKLMDSLAPTEIKRVISLLKGKDTVTRAWRSSLAEWLIEREEIKKRDKAEAEERRRRNYEEIGMYIKRSEELKAKGMKKISKDGRFLNIRAGGFSRFCREILDQGYSKEARQKLVEALSGTPIIEELEILDKLKDQLRKEADIKTVFT
ncbi:hypothetical protein AgCh_028977 [Apium graveolens]